MSEVLPSLAAEASGGVGLLYNATASVITNVGVAAIGPAADVMGSPDVEVEVTTHAVLNAPLAPLTLFPADQATGTSVISGCSFPIPASGLFTVTVQFQTGEQVMASVSTRSQAAPALFIVAFLNGIVVARPSGTATSIAFSRAPSQFLMKEPP